MRLFVIFLIWVMCATVMVFFIFLPIDARTQLVTTFIVLLGVIVLKYFQPKGSMRMVLLALGTSIVLRYVYWRTTSTLPPVNQPMNFVPGLLLYLAEMFSVCMLFLSLFVVSRPLAPRPPSPGLDEQTLPTVDIFIPTYNEDAMLLAHTIAAACNIDYPEEKFTVWLLDDGGTEQKRGSMNLLEAKTAEKRYAELQLLCQQLGIKYLAREKNEHAKAGNLNNGLAHSTGELVAVFDADHAPARDFLKETVGHFSTDPRLFLVQTPHFFINPDPIERNLKTFQHMPSENEMFYGIIQRGLDKWNAAFFCGSAALLRREALTESEGFSGLSITEDCETALELHSRGWNSIYIDTPLIAGLQPETFASFIGQRSRWAQGMMQIMRFQFPLFKRGLSFAQRLCYLSSTMFWLFPFPRFIFLLSPLLYLFFDLQIFTASGGEFMAYTVSYMVANLLIQNSLYGSFRWPWISELYEYVQSIHLLPAVVSVAVNPTKPTFKVTAKDESVSQNRLSEISRPFFVIFFVLLIAFGVTIYRLYTEPFKVDITLVVGGWNLLNLLLAGCALGVVSERRERQTSRRVKVKRRAEVEVDGRWYPAMIRDVSLRDSGIQIFTKDTAKFPLGAHANLRFEAHGRAGKGELPIEITRSRADGEILDVGCRFMPEDAGHHGLVADLIFANSDQWKLFQNSRRHNPGVLRGTLWFIRLSLIQTVRGLQYLLFHRQSAQDSKTSRDG